MWEILVGKMFYWVAEHENQQFDQNHPYNPVYGLTNLYNINENKTRRRQLTQRKLNMKAVRGSGL